MLRKLPSPLGPGSLADASETDTVLAGDSCGARHVTWLPGTRSAESACLFVCRFCLLACPPPNPPTPLHSKSPTTLSSLRRPRQMETIRTRLAALRSDLSLLRPSPHHRPSPIAPSLSVSPPLSTQSYIVRDQAEAAAIRGVEQVLHHSCQR